MPSEGHVKDNPNWEKGDAYRMKTKIAVLFALMIFSLAIAGAAYAAWTETFTLSAVVYTANFDVDVSATLDGWNNPYGSLYPTPSVSASNNDPSGGGGVLILFDKAIPGSYATANVAFKNNGDVPAEITAVVAPIVSENGFQIDPTGKIAITLAGTNPPTVGDVIAAGATQSFTMKVEVLSGALEGATYTIVLPSPTFDVA